MELFTAVEAFTQVMTYVMIVAGVPPCLEMIKSRVTEGVPYPFFLAGLVNSLLSIGYGVMVDNSTLIQINAVAGFFNVFYVGSYVFISPKKSAPLQQLLLSVLLVLAVQVYASRLVPEVQRQDHVGFILLVVSTVMLLTPWLQVVGTLTSSRKVLRVPAVRCESVPGDVGCRHRVLYGMVCIRIPPTRRLHIQSQSTRVVLLCRPDMGASGVRTGETKGQTRII
ncbi:uncharacterized protein LOC127877633 isoform X1 [Dreissena polymorpha]|uniref:uncharacterized protein LOC127877633 isoform X1 n=1 Tax=Dreissena polymorpha TaxID=45954 RepID=UPI0022646D34|nr:uncharacterized protein LOC127877633 isoform X1 [Dreissena polymorpha]XP_052279667.1 uncharacterized protein LOC127877633 isoform X1 [Dreissena polymorpha]XP_052279668.1 uncharacterized protein LOC127877633 isoform X1 [Dreissena polymorpha]XP_052279669.1 uncharacterized protein LOC127877633 isoform X1 [Dreissena polymorpha]XP_052279670.1 uncharacterized protein LOC127877633 isoform X1 [Dreissena polymorpha]